MIIRNIEYSDYILYSSTLNDLLQDIQDAAPELWVNNDWNYFIGAFSVMSADSGSDVIVLMRIPSSIGIKLSTLPKTKLLSSGTPKEDTVQKAITNNITDFRKVIPITKSISGFWKEAPDEPSQS